MKINAPKNTLTEELGKEIRQRKAEILHYFQYSVDNHINVRSIVKIVCHIDFEIFRKPLVAHIELGKAGSKGGRPSFDYLMMFKILILQRYYNLSDDGTEYAILDRLSFMRFSKLTISDTVPNAKTIWNFKNELDIGKMARNYFPCRIKP